MVVKLKNQYHYSDVTVLLNFSYIDFKIWWLRLLNKNKAVEDSKMFVGWEEEEVFFSIEIIEEAMKNIQREYGGSFELRPPLPLKREALLKEIVGELDLDNDVSDAVKK